MKESRFIEFKSEISNSFLKTVSAYSNIGTGIIKFGYNDDGTICGLNEDLNKVCLDLENKINDSINPKPDYRFECDYNNKTIILLVYEDLYKPYMYKSKAYKRNDSSTIEMDILELHRIILEGKNLSFEQLDVDEELEFNSFGEKVKSILNINLNSDILKTFGLINDNVKFNKAALIVSDNNNISGVDIIKFGDNINQIMDRIIVKNKSIFDMFDSACTMFNKYYTYEEIRGINRNRIELIPESAFREALANALIHRTWDDTPNIRIFMYNDKIEIISPGGLVHSISKEEYLNGQVSKPRNPILANIFFRLKYVEMFGTGILRIKQLYQSMKFKPDFKIYENSISIVLPLVDLKLNVSVDEEQIINYLSNCIHASSSDIAKSCGYTKDKTLRLLKLLQSKGYVKVSGNGKATKYSI